MSGNTVVIAIAVLALWKMHKEVMAEVKGLTHAITELATGHAVHAEKLDTGDKRFDKMESRLDDMVKHMHTLKNNVITKEQAKELLDLAYKKKE